MASICDFCIPSTPCTGLGRGVRFSSYKLAREDGGIRGSCRRCDEEPYRYPHQVHDERNTQKRKGCGYCADSD